MKLDDDEKRSIARSEGHATGICEGMGAALSVVLRRPSVDTGQGAIGWGVALDIAAEMLRRFKDHGRGEAEVRSRAYDAMSAVAAADFCRMAADRYASPCTAGGADV